MSKKPTHTLPHDCPDCSYIGQFTLSEVYDHLFDFYICDSGLVGMTIVVREHDSTKTTYVFKIEMLQETRRKLNDIEIAAKRVLGNPKVKALITRKKNKKAKSKK